MMNPTREVPLGEGSETDYLDNVPPPGKVVGPQPTADGKAAGPNYKPLPEQKGDYKPLPEQKTKYKEEDDKAAEDKKNTPPSSKK
jgi:hypothetical protein